MKRWDETGYPSMEERKDGEYVKHEDAMFAIKIERNGRLAAERQIEHLRKKIRDMEERDDG